jgi:pseudaminic acid biosynthesis-associated methylase
MTDTTTTAPESSTARLEALWAGGFGDAYLERNAHAAEGRAPFWDGFMERYPSRRVLEIGCTQGDNLLHIARHVPTQDIWGVDVNQEVLASLHRHVPGVNGVWGVARSLPFRDAWFDLVFTVGLLIHQPDESLPLVMGEIVRTSRRWVLCGEYHSDEPTEVHYRGHDGVLFKRDYGKLYTDLFPELTLVEERYLTKDDGFDRVTFHLFEKS